MKKSERHQRVFIAGRKYAPGADQGIAALLTAAGWVFQRLPSQISDADRRADVVRTLAQARNLIIEVTYTPIPGVRVRDGQRVLFEISLQERRTLRGRQLLAPDLHAAALRIGDPDEAEARDLLQVR